MKKLFKRIVASVLTAAIAMSAAVTSVSAAMTVKGATEDNKLAIEVDESKVLTISGAVGTLKAESSAAATATATLDGTKVTVKGIAAGTANVTITDDNKTADDTKDDVTVTIAVTVTKFETAAAKLYTDEAATKAVTDAGVYAYVNGIKTKGDNAVDYKSVNLYAKEAATGKYVAVVTEKNEQPAITAGKVTSDASVKNIAKVAVKDKTVTITAGKQTGTVYVWLFDMDTTKKRANSVASAKVEMKGASSSIVIGTENTLRGTDKTLKTGVIGSGKTAKFYFADAIKDAAKDVANTLATDLTYTVEADAKNKIELKVNYTKEGKWFEVTAPEIAPDAKGKVKTASGKVTVTNIQSGKKVSLTIVVGNDITATANTIKSGYATLIDEKGDVSKIDVDPTMSNDKIASTNKVSVVVLNGEAAFNDKAKLTTTKSKTFGAKLQARDFGTEETPAPGYRVRLTFNAPKKDAANAVVYLVVTDAAKKTTYYEIARATKEGAVTATAKGVAVVQEAPAKTE